MTKNHFCKDNKDQKTAADLSLVSIIIPVYNGANYLREAIDSALAQTYTNIEILVINDGSNDKGETEKIALSYGNKIRYFSKDNGGVSSALNLGIKEMKGEYFSWLSHDDVYLPEKIEQNLAALTGKEKTRIVYSDFERIDENGNYLETIGAQKIHPHRDYTNGLFPILRGLIYGCTPLIYKQLFEHYGLFREDLRTTQDYELFFRMFRGQQLIYIPQTLVKARVHGKQVTKVSDQTLPECETLWQDILSQLTSKETAAIDGSEQEFWLRQASFLQESTSYRQAQQYAWQRWHESMKALTGIKRFTAHAHKITTDCVYNLKRRYRHLKRVIRQR